MSAAARNKKVAGIVAALGGLFVLSLVLGSSLGGADGSNDGVLKTNNLRGDSDKQEPPTRELLGKSTWTFLHRMAAQFDKEPTDAKKKQMTDFLRSFGDFYPCHECAEHFRGMLDTYPPEESVDGNLGLSMYLCKLHNKVNERLHKRQFPCETEKLQERWGDCGCFESSSGDSSE